MFFPKGSMSYMALGVQSAQLLVEAQTVMALRMLGMAGLWTVSPAESTRMVFEKPDAFIRSASAATGAMLAGKRPDQVAAAAIKPLRRKTRANSRRLTRAGPKTT